jgi:hypothetical protein
MELKQSRELGEALIHAFSEQRQLPVTSVKKDRTVFKGPLKWVVAVVGPQL